MFDRIPSRLRRMDAKQWRQSALLSVFLGLSVFLVFYRPSFDNPGAEAAPRRSNLWVREFYHLNEVAAAHPEAQLVFLGDTHLNRFDYTGRPVWNRYYEHRKPLNLGVDNDATEHLLYRIENGNLAGLDPKVFVVMVGTYNTHVFDRPWQIYDGTLAIVDRLRDDFPDAEILLVGPLPRDTPRDHTRIILDEVNGRLAETEFDERVHYIDVGDRFVHPDGSIRARLMPNGLHLSGQGYNELAQAIEPELASLLGDRHVTAIAAANPSVPIVGF